MSQPIYSLVLSRKVQGEWKKTRLSGLFPSDFADNAFTGSVDPKFTFKGELGKTITLKAGDRFTLWLNDVKPKRGKKKG